MESVTFVTEPLMHPDFVQFRVVAPLLQRLRGRWDVALAAPSLSEEVQSTLDSMGIRPLNGGAWFPPIRNSRDEIPSYAWSWTRDALLGRNQRGIERAIDGQDGIRVNHSMTSAVRADCWLVESRPLEQSLTALRPSVDIHVRLLLRAAGPIVGPIDLRHIVRMARLARSVFTSSGYVAGWFAEHGIAVDGVFPMYWSPEFRPTTASPSRDFVLCYLAKETDVGALTKLLRTGLPIRLFGAKTASWVGGASWQREFPNVQFLGRVSHEDLRALYSNALFTAFPFTEESFGLVPLESMACGTPVLTYAAQGPGESVVDGKSGWLTRSPDEFVARALDLFRTGYGTEVSRLCLDRAGDFSIDTACSNWDKLLRMLANRQSEARPGPIVAGRTGTGFPAFSSSP